MAEPDLPHYAVATFTPLRTTLTYSGPPDLQPGTRVRVPLGSRTVTGIVLAPAEPAPDLRIRPLEVPGAPEPLLPESLMALGHWLARYYHAPVGEAFELLTPALARSGEALTAPAAPRVLWLTEKGRALQPEQLRGTRQQQLIGLLRQESGVDRTRLKEAGIPLATVHKLEAEHLVCWEDVESGEPRIPADSDLTLSDAQAALYAQVDPGRFDTHLVLGATGSGKTELYIEWVRAALQAGRQALVLLPEIGLTPQMLQRFGRRLGVPVSALHSGMTDTARWKTWHALRAGTARVVLGTRSAVFAALPDLGLIIVDEEHDPAYKQWEGVRYHARDVAIWRAHRADCPVVLGSATPALETLYNARDGRFQWHRLPRRAEQGDVARSLIDLRRQDVAHGLSASLTERVDEHLRAGNQVMLFLNRRGIAPSMACDHCGTLQHCPNCSAYLTYHNPPARLLCHHCGWQHRPPYPCEHCGQTRLTPLGVGTGGLEDYLARRWPDVERWRVDRDAVRNTADWETINRALHSGRPGILFGTQMLAKGHDYPNVTLTGILDADSGLFSADFRAFERAAQLLTQVSGRAGRRRARAEVILQTRLPDHPLLNDFLSMDYEKLAETLLEERRLGHMPPFSFLATVRADHADESVALDYLERCAEQTVLPEDVRLIGPMPALMSRRAGQYRMLLLLRSDRRRQLHQGLDALAHTLGTVMKTPGGLTWGIDVDPLEF